jgi:flavorubredoxin/flavin reductase (DIM6/NTAB) family NADH-FMN oxidoreductase RutF
MQTARQLTTDLYMLGGSDRRLALFENVFPIPRGISYNAFLITDEKTVLVDTVDKSVATVFFDSLAYALNGRPLDYVVIQHMEPDHAATLSDLLMRYPQTKLVCNKKTITLLNQFFDFKVAPEIITVDEGDTLTTGRHTLTFYMAPMVHWPEVMVTYDSTDRVLFSADAFGTFGALSGNVYADEVNFESEWLPDARRYYTNIVGKYGTQVRALLKKAAKLNIALLCPLHGPVWRKNIGWYVDKYETWASYEPEDPNSVMIAYASVYGGTENAATVLANALAERGVRNIAMYDVSVTHPSVIVAEAFRCSHLVFASTTYNAGIFFNMESALIDLKEHNLQKRTVALIENGSWAPTAGSLMLDLICSMKDMDVIDGTVTIKSAPKESQRADFEALADSIVGTMKLPAAPTAAPVGTASVDQTALFKISYGLFILSARDGDKDNGCIINTAIQVTDTPKRISVTVNKLNMTHDMIMKTGEFCLSVLTEDTPFSVFQKFGFTSGRKSDKFAGYSDETRAANGVRYVADWSNSYIAGHVVETHDLGTHTEFVADVTDAKILSTVPSATYQYYFDHIKPKPPKAEEKKKGFVCTICGYVYEGDTLPPDYVCPICLHGADAFVPLE